MSCCGPAARSIHMRTAEKILSPRRASNVSTFKEIDWQAVKESGANSPSSAPPTAAMKPGRLVPDDTLKKNIRAPRTPACRWASTFTPGP